MNQQLSLEIVALNQLEVGERSDYVSGYGEDATKVVVEGEIVELCVRRNKRIAFVIRVMEDGSLVINGHDSLYHLDLRSLTLYNDRPWKKEKE
jgi:hypothetical protein